MKKIKSKFLKSSLLVLAFAVCKMNAVDYRFPTYAENGTVNALEIGNKFSISGIAGKAEMKQSTVKEKGWLYGAKINFDDVLDNNLYVGCEVGYKSGTLKGNGDATFISLDFADPRTGIQIPQILAIDSQAKSKYSDAWAEARVGFTLSNYTVYPGGITPYFVLGYEKEKDEFVSPSVLQLKHSIDYAYIGLGATSKFAINEILSVGANVKFKWMFNSKAKTSGTQEPISQDVEEKKLSPANYFHWSIETPIAYQVSPTTFISLAPFYEYKNYERHKLANEGSEKATFTMYGATINIGWAY